MKSYRTIELFVQILPSPFPSMSTTVLSRSDEDMNIRAMLLADRTFHLGLTNCLPTSLQMVRGLGLGKTSD